MKGKGVLFVTVFSFFTIGLFGQETLLERANAFYDREDYTNAKELYLQVLSNGKFTGEILFRYVNSIEMIDGPNPDVFKLYNATYEYLSMDGSNKQYQDYCVEILENNNAFDYLLTRKQAIKIVNNHIKENGIKYSPLKNITNSLRSTGNFGVILFLIIAIIVYVLAYSFSKKTKCIIIWSWWDLIFIAVSSLIFVYYLFDIENNIKNDAVINVIYFISIITTFTFSIISNLKYSAGKWLLFAIISIVTKFVLLIVIPLILVLAILFWFLANSGKRDRRYKDGTKNNQKTANQNFYIPMFTAIYSFLIINLIKNDKKLKEE